MKSIQHTDWLKAILLIGLVSFPLLLQAQLHIPHFQQLSSEEGLSQATVMTVETDDKGMIWFGTQGGLNRYNGYAFDVFTHHTNDSLSLAINIIHALHSDGRGNMWIGTEGKGLDKFSLAHRQIIHYAPNSNNGLKNGYIYAIEAGLSPQDLWIATGDGLYLFNTETGKFQHFPHEIKGCCSIGKQRIRSLRRINNMLWLSVGSSLFSFDMEKRIYTHHFRPLPSPKNTIHTIGLVHDTAVWLGTEQGLFEFDLAKGNAKEIPIEGTKRQKRITSILKDHRGAIWLGTYGGLAKANKPIGFPWRFTFYQNHPTDPYSLSHDRVETLYEDRNGTLWVGTYYGGISKLDSSCNKFPHYKKFGDLENTISSDIVRAVAKDSEGLLWIGTENGLNRIDRANKEIKHFFSNNSSLPSNDIRSIATDSARVWIGTAKTGLCYYEKSKDIYVEVSDNHAPDIIDKGDIRALHISPDGSLWVGTRLNGVFRLRNPNFAQPNEQSWEVYNMETQTLNNNYTLAITSDSLDNIWIGTWGGGISKLNSKGELTVFHPKSFPEMPSDIIKTICIAKDGTLWAGTAGFGLFSWADLGKGEIIKHTTDNGLPDNNIYGILEDGQGQLWASSNKGIAKISVPDSTIRVYGVHDGLQADEFNTGAYGKSTDGEMVFGGINGFNSFYPQSIQDNQTLSSPVISELRIFNQPSLVQPVQLGSKPLAVTYANEFLLNYAETQISFEIAQTHYANVAQNQLQYRLEGFEDHWFTLPYPQHHITYTNLSAKDYTLYVKASNNDGVWGQEVVAAKFRVNPPFWQKWWFILLCISLFIWFVYQLLRWRLKKIAFEKVKLEEVIEERTKEVKRKNEELQISTEDLKQTVDQLELLKQQLSHSLEEEKKQQQWITQAYSQLEERGFRLEASEKEIKKQAEALKKSNRKLNKIAADLEEALSREQSHNKELEEAHEYLKKTQAQLVQSEKMASLGVLVAGIAHEINNPINYISGGSQAIEIQLEEIWEALDKYENAAKEENLQLLAKAYQYALEEGASEVKEDIVNMLKHIQEGIKRVANIVKGLREFSRKNKGTFKYMPLHRSIDNTLVLLSPKYKKQHINIVKQYELTDDTIEYMPDELAQVWMNVLSNAIDAVDAHGTIIIHSSGNEQNVMIRIQDDGEGVPEELVSRIFDPFFTTKDIGAGTGLGLAISFGIIEQHKGHIEVENAEGGGACFTLTLPRKQRRNDEV